jgi:hypothetical protein
MVRMIENRPTAILNHRIIVADGNSGIILMPDNFRSATPITPAMLWPVAYPNKDGTLVFYSTRSSTDQVSVIGTGLKLSIGREQIKNPWSMACNG